MVLARHLFGVLVFVCSIWVLSQTGESELHNGIAAAMLMVGLAMIICPPIPREDIPDMIKLVGGAIMLSSLVMLLVFMSIEAMAWAAGGFVFGAQLLFGRPPKIKTAS
jgi:hypothetical protein